MGIKCLGGEDDKMEDVMKTPCKELVNWDDIKNVISYSNVIQRDNLLFAKKLDKELIPVALEGDKNAKSYDKLWAEKARRAVLKQIMDEWQSKQNREPTVQKLLSALSVPGFMDVKFRVIKLLEKNLAENKV